MAGPAQIEIARKIRERESPCPTIWSPYDRGMQAEIEQFPEAIKRFVAYRHFLLADRLGDIRAKKKIEEWEEKYRKNGTPIITEQTYGLSYGLVDFCYKVPEEHQRNKVGE